MALIKPALEQRAIVRERTTIVTQGLGGNKMRQANETVEWSRRMKKANEADE